MNRAVLLALLLGVSASAVHAKDDLDLQRLRTQLAQLESDPSMGEFADGDRSRAHQALDDLAAARSWQRDHALYIAERRVATAQFEAQAELGAQQLQQLDREHDRILLEASRLDAARARARADRLVMQNQAREEAEQRAQIERDAQAQVEAGIAQTESEQTEVIAAARARAAELARQEAALKAGAPIATATPAPVHDARGQSRLLAGTAFGSGQAVLLPGAKAQLRALVAFVQASPSALIRIEGYTDSQGSADTNLKLSQQRAEAVRVALVAAGVKAARIDAVGLGAERPIADNKTADGRARNRRVEVIVLRPTR